VFFPPTPSLSFMQGRGRGAVCCQVPHRPLLSGPVPFLGSSQDPRRALYYTVLIARSFVFVSAERLANVQAAVALLGHARSSWSLSVSAPRRAWFRFHAAALLLSLVPPALCPCPCPSPTHFQRPWALGAKLMPVKDRGTGHAKEKRGQSLGGK
jgi:hypothetical protein